ncbi:CPBP family intramembrane glutamic endopeptidase [Halolamina rubra]|uniref:CPBP family intramembrane glutamic endopeptidase n=1 Tax=Halolamina rubra TaxID=1380430 RepID=UPI0006790E25|nr:type II CAAX endopeptidase family protein [Halolamina rubra]
MSDRIRSWIDRHRLITFVAIAYAFTWTIQGTLAYSGMEASWTHSILIGLGGFGPPIGAATVVWASGGSLGTWIGQMFKWRIGAKWWALALGLPLLILVLGVALFVVAGGPIDLTGLESPLIYLFAMAWGTVWGGGQEDLGWRGFMLPILQDSYSALTSSVIVGVTWAAWHLPLFLNATTTHGGWPRSQQLLWMVSILAGSILWTWMYNSTGGSVLAVAVFHAGVNSMGIYHPADPDALVPNGVPDPWLNLLAEVTGAIPLVLIAVVLVVVYGPGRLANREPPTPQDAGLPPDAESTAAE